MENSKTDDSTSHLGIRAVFIHLGSSSPKHLWLNLKRHREMFPQVPLDLVLSDKRLRQFVPEGVNVIDYQRTVELDEVLHGLELSPSFRKGFWHFTIERLLVLKQVHMIHPDDAILHVESDVLLMPSFPWQQLKYQRKLMWGRADANEDIAALVFSPNFELTELLTKLITEEMVSNSLTSDMRALRATAKQLPKEKFDYLCFSFEQPSFFGGLFDVLAFGMWLGGMDPSNARGLQTFHISMPHHTVRANEFSYHLIGNKLFAKRGLEQREIFSLHVHSKEPKVFGSNWLETLSKWVGLSKNPLPIRKFVLRGFYAWLRELLVEIFSAKGLVAIWSRLKSLFQ
jgi:hypothetical protein